MRYEGACSGKGIGLKPFPAYRDYVEWLGGKKRSDAEEFWRRTLKGFVAPTPLGGDSGKRQSAVARVEVRHETSALSAEETRELRAFAARAWAEPLDGAGGDLGNAVESIQR